jgi:single-strand DNA-binding protein
MKSMRNVVHLIGHLGKNPEVKVLTNGNKRATFSIATNDSYKNQKGEKVQETQWHNVVAWGKLADLVDQYLENGQEVVVEGRLIHRVYETQDGAKRFITEIVAHDFLMVGGRPAAAA